MAHARDKTILVVDDEPDVRMFLTACAEDAGFTVEDAEDGQVALERLAHFTPDLITLDMVMPRKNGIATLRELRKLAHCEDIPVILITAHLRDELGQEAIRQLTALPVSQRPRVVLEKPINPPELCRTIAEILQVEIDEDDYGLASSQQSLSSQVRNADTQILARINARLKEP